MSDVTTSADTGEPVDETEVPATEPVVDLTGRSEEPSDETPDEAPDGAATVVDDTVARVASGIDGEVEVPCPGCGLVLVGESPRPTASWFCPRCDYPLFWAAQPDPGAAPPSSAARRRLPGTGGVQVLGAEPCWHCGEMSEPGAVECVRCAAVLPKPLAPHVVVKEPFPVPHPVAVKVPVWPWVAAAACAAAAVATAVTLAIAGGG